LFIFVKNQGTPLAIFLADYLPLQLQHNWRYQYLISNLKSVKNSSSPARAITSASPRCSSVQQKCRHINVRYRPRQTKFKSHTNYFYKKNLEFHPAKVFDLWNVHSINWLPAVTQAWRFLWRSIWICKYNLD
jgi:hypothetical protein